MELKTHDLFGSQIKKARNVYEDLAKAIANKDHDPLVIAKSIHAYFKDNYQWNGEFGFMTDNGVKKTEELKKGNVADLNLSMLGALQEAGLEAVPVLISTRARGLPIKVHPVLTDFNYVLVRLQIKEKVYLLDATSSLNTFGFVPRGRAGRCTSV